MGKRTNTAKWDEKTKRWKINVQKDGRRRSFYSSTPGRNGQREANRKADEWLDEGIDNGIVRVNDMLDKYLIKIENTTSKSNLRKEEYHVSFIRKEIGHRRVSSVTENDLQSIIDNAYRHKDKETGEIRELSKKTLMNIRATITAFMKFCRMEKVSTLRPESITIPKSARFKGIEILQPESLKILFTCDTVIYRGKRVFDDYIYAYRFIVLTGLRPGELRALERKNIKGYQVNINGAINSYNEHTQGKNENAIRGFFMTDIAKATIEAQMNMNPNSELVFDIASTSTFRHRWTRYCESNEIPPTSLYALRHTFVSVVKKLPEGEVKPIIGHSKDMDTFGTYGHEISGEQQQVAEEINSLFVNLISESVVKSVVNK